MQSIRLLQKSELRKLIMTVRHCAGTSLTQTAESYHFDFASCDQQRQSVDRTAVAYANSDLLSDDATSFSWSPAQLASVSFFLQSSFS